MKYPDFSSGIVAALARALEIVLIDPEDVQPGEFIQLLRLESELLTLCSVSVHS